MSWRMLLTSLAATVLDCLSLRFRFLPLLERRWLLNPRARLIFPVPVSLNRFAALLLVLIFGT